MTWLNAQRARVGTTGWQLSMTSAKAIPMSIGRHHCLPLLVGGPLHMPKVLDTKERELQMAVTPVQQGGALEADTPYRVSFYLYNADQVGITSFWLKVLTPTTGAALGDLANDFANLAETAVQVLHSSQTAFLGVKVSKYSIPATAPPLSGIASSDSLGTVGATDLPLQISGVLTLTTALGGQAYRGRMFWPFAYSSANAADNTPSAGYISSLSAMGSIILNYTLNTGPGFWTGGGWNCAPIIFHKATVTTTNLVGTVAQNKWGGQHRRGSYGKTNSRTIPI